MFCALIQNTHHLVPVLLSVILAAVASLVASAQTPNLPELIAQTPHLQLLAQVLGNNGLIPTLSG